MKNRRRYNLEFKRCFINITLQSVALLLSIFVISESPCYAGRVGPPVTLEQMVDDSDVIFKAKIISSKTIKVDWFNKYNGFSVYGTEMQLISVVKGEITEDKIIFQHYGQAKNSRRVYRIMPQYYNLSSGKTYIVFAKKTDSDRIFRQLWKFQKSKADQGVFLSADIKPFEKDKTVTEIVWDELNKLLLSPKDIVYAINQLDSMSRSTGWDKLDDFDRNTVMSKIHKFVLSKDEEVAMTAIKVMGWASPYLYDDYAKGWLASIGKGKIHGYSEWTKERKNVSARKYWEDLVSVVNGNGPVKNRALAIRALGLANESKVLDHVTYWVKDAEPLIRQCAIILLSDFPSKRTQQLIKKYSQDDIAEVRLGVARAIGFGQYEVLIPVLERLLRDQDLYVANAAYVSLLSFDLSKVKYIFKKYKDDPEWKAILVNPLAEENAEPYLEDLAEIVEMQMSSKYFKGGIIPSFLSWKILFKYLQYQSIEKLRPGDFDRYFDALESAKFHSSGPRDLYAFYIHHRMIKRAKAFREKYKTTNLNMEYFFDMVDAQKDYYIDTSIYSNYGVKLDK